MRFILAIAVLFSVVAAASLRPKTFENPMVHANMRSFEFVQADNNDSSGFRPCAELPDSGLELGIVCEGRRQIQDQVGQLHVVNYFCEFRFSKNARGLFRLEYELCQ